MTGKKIWRCAIYTRKSSDEGLEQDFNSLDAQRESCEAYVRSQAQEGWRILLQPYDDGGISGGTLERPGLKRLLGAVEAGEVDIIVLYKIDRLTRSLTDFAKLAELFDAKGVSFVSVTQQFNTTTSMGRLMLNVLLSFAQFEREVTGERIRDKIAASKKKGMWMGGTVPLGYDVQDRELVIEPEGADTIRLIFRRYLDLGTVGALEEDLAHQGIRTKVRTYGNGRTTGDRPFARGHLYRLLSAPIYIGHVPHKDKSYPGLHEAIIDRATWDKAQAALAANTQGPRKRRARVKEGGPLLAGILTDDSGTPFTPNHANKKGKRYRYYVEKAAKPELANPLGGSRPNGIAENSAIRGAGIEFPGAEATGIKFRTRRPRRKRIPALEIEAIIRWVVNDLIASPTRLLDTLSINRAEDVARTLEAAGHLHASLSKADPTTWDRTMAATLTQVIWRNEDLVVRFDPIIFRAKLGLTTMGNTKDFPADHNANECSGDICDETAVIGPDVPHPEIVIPVRVRSRGVEMKLILPGANGDAIARNVDPALIKAVARGYRWFRMLRDGEAPSVGAIATAEGITTSFISRTMRLAFLSPTLIEQILDGAQPPDMTVDWLMESGNVPVRWEGRGVTMENRCDYQSPKACNL